MQIRASLIVIICSCFVTQVLGADPQPSAYTPVGVAKVDITPDYPVRMSGYGARLKENEGIGQRIFATALVMGGEPLAGTPSVPVVNGPLTAVVTVENLGIPKPMTERIAARLKDRLGLERPRFVIASTHTHTAPVLRECAANIFAEPYPEDQAGRLARYEAELTDQLVAVVEKAVAARQPGRLSWGTTTAKLNVNRRVLKDGKWVGFGNQPDGPIDQRLPVLAVHGADGKLRAVWCNFAMHCTVHGGGFMQISGDWAGSAMELIEADHPGVSALISIGCGADQGPRVNGGLGEARILGREFANAVKELLQQPLTPVAPRIDCQFLNVELPFLSVPSREQLESDAKRKDVTGSNARYFLSLLDAGKEIPKTLDYPIGTWTFGRDLAMVFLGGEVVVDYSLHIQRDFDPQRVWITAYANDVPCYIPTRRLMEEGGYEVDFSMLYYRRPGRLGRDTEDIILDTVQKLLPREYYSAEKQSLFPPAKSPYQSLASMTVRPGMRVELVASEPLVQSPVAFDWDEFGRLWVVEMTDYPNGVMSPEARAFQSDELRGQPGGRVKLLTDTNGDGQFDHAETFLEGLAFPTGIQCWRKGVLIVAAPQILYAADTNGDGRADQREVIFSGFSEGNQQHRVNGFRWGLDNWLYLANGDSGGNIQAEGHAPVAISGRDLRIRPDQLLVEAVSGQSQFGRVRDDWGHWFGCNNSRPIWLYALDDSYLRRNPYLAVKSTQSEIAAIPGAAPVFPTSHTLARYNDFDRANRFTSACGLEIYRDRALGDAFYGNAFVCEPVHNLVSRLVLTEKEGKRVAQRFSDEQETEFLASGDNWFRPVFARTGPEGGLWVADMYRAVIEHPRWIPPEWQRKLNLRDGSERGRIYRVTRADRPSPKVPSRPVDQPVTTMELVKQLASSNGWQRDAAQRILVERQDQTAVSAIRELLQHTAPEVRLQALCTLDGLHAVTKNDFRTALEDSHPQLRRHAIRVGETLLDEELLARALKSLADPEVAQQLGYSLGNSPLSTASISQGLVEVLRKHHQNSFIVSAALSSLKKETAGMVAVQLAKTISVASAEERSALLDILGQVAGISARMQEGKLSPQIIAPFLAGGQNGAGTEVMFGILKQLLNSLNSTEIPQTLKDQPGWPAVRDRALKMAEDRQVPESERIAALELLAVAVDCSSPEWVETFNERLVASEPPAVQAVALTTLIDLGQADQISQLFERWRSFSPALRQQALDRCLSREATTLLLLTAIEQQKVSPQDFDAVRRDRLLSHKQARIREQAAKLLSVSVSKSRVEILAAYQTVGNLVGDTTRGRALFEKRCSNCHRLQDVGRTIGADLNAVKDRSTSALLTAILDPNRAVEARYYGYVALTTDGRSFSGLMASETSTAITLIGADGKEVSLLRTEIEELSSSEKSLMPEGLEKDLSPQEMADVIVFVQGGLPTPPAKEFPGNTPRLVTPDADGRLLLTATAAEIRGPTLVFEPHYRNLGYWQSPDDSATWTLQLKSPGKFRVEMVYAVPADMAGDRFQILVAGQTLEEATTATGSWDSYQALSLGQLTIPAGTHRLTMLPTQEPRGALLDLQELRLVPVK